MLVRGVQKRFMQIHEFPGRYCIHLLTKALTVGGEKKLSRKGWRVERSRASEKREREREKEKDTFSPSFWWMMFNTKRKKERKEKEKENVERRLKGNVTVCGLHYKMAGGVEGGTDIADYLRDVLFYEPDRTYRMCPFFFSFFLFFLSTIWITDALDDPPFPRNASRAFRRGDNKSLPLVWPLLLVPLVPSRPWYFMYTMLFLFRPKVYSCYVTNARQAVNYFLEGK